MNGWASRGTATRATPPRSPISSAPAERHHGAPAGEAGHREKRNPECRPGSKRARRGVPVHGGPHQRRSRQCGQEPDRGRSVASRRRRGRGRSLAGGRIRSVRSRRFAARRTRRSGPPATARSPLPRARSGRGCPGRARSGGRRRWEATPVGRSIRWPPPRSPAASRLPPPRPRQDVVEERPGGREAGERLLGRAADADSAGPEIVYSASALRTPSHPSSMGRRSPGGGESVVDGARVARQRVGLEAAGRPVGGEDADRIGTELAGEVGVALGHRRADQGPDLQARCQHGLAERDPVGDVRGEDDDVGARRRELGHEPAPSPESSGCSWHAPRSAPRMRWTVATAASATEVAYASSAATIATRSSAVALPRRDASSVAAKVAEFEPRLLPARPDPEHHRQPAARQPIRDGAGLPVDEARCVGRLAGGDRQVRPVGADDDLDPLLLQGGHRRGGIARALRRSRTSSSIGRPAMPPSALTRSAAICTPRSSSPARSAALPPSGKTAPIRIGSPVGTLRTGASPRCSRPPRGTRRQDQGESVVAHGSSVTAFSG